MVEVTVKGYTWMELDDNAKDTAFYYIECYVNNVQDYNVNLLNKKIKEELKEVEDGKIILEAHLANVRKRIKNEIDKSGNFIDVSLSPIYDKVKCLITEETEVLKRIIHNTNKKAKLERERKKNFDKVCNGTNYKVAYALCDENELYFTVDGFPLFNGALDTEIVLENL